MPPIPAPKASLPRVVVYYQTLHHSTGDIPVSVLPLIAQPGISLTHLILAAIHINEDPHAITLNDHHPSHPRYHTLWAELSALQASGIKVLGMLGGAAKGSYARLDGTEENFEKYYTPVRDMIRERNLDGLDLDVEEAMSLEGIIRLIDRLRSDFGPDFIITLAPVAAALIWSNKNLSGFDYEALEVMRGHEIAWYNAQFYCGWGDISNTLMYDAMVQRGYRPDKVVVGLVTNPSNGAGWVPWFILSTVLRTLKAKYETFGGVMGWEYFNSLPGGLDRPWEWARDMTTVLRGHLLAEETHLGEVDIDDPTAKDVELPAAFEYHSDGTEEEE